jgi:hypothetical protein
MDAPLSSPTATDLDRRIIAGWAAIEHGDLRGARAALSDVYSVDEAHPGLPLLAAAIRRTRPNRMGWRSAFFLLIVIVGSAFVVYLTMTAPVRQSASTSGEVASQSSLDGTDAGLAADSVGTSGKSAGSASTGSAQTHRPQETGQSAGSDDALIRQGIARFATAYSNRFKPVAFSSCDVARNADSATVTCQARGADPSDEEAGDGTWIFTCRKAADAWKIVSIQPPAE